MTDGPPIRATALAKTYRLGFWFHKKVQALRGLDLLVEPGQVYGLLGPNGAGKSTTIKILMDLVRPSSGEAQLFGRAPGDPHCRSMVGFVPENPAPYDYLTGREFVSLAGRLSGLRSAALTRRINEVLDQVGLSRAASLQLRKYSKGMVQRVAVAQALVAKPKMLILDEPTSGLDPVGRREMRDLILSERARGTTVLFCTHIIADVEAVCDRVAVLVAGRRVREGAVNELLTAQVPTMEGTFENVSEATLRQSGAPIEQVVTQAGRLRIHASDAAMQTLLRAAVNAGGRVVHLAPVRFSLEDLFLQALQEAGTSSVGADIS